MIAVDTSVVIAALLAWHEHHARAARALERALASPGGVLLPVATLVESYAVMTRLPPPHRISPAVALELLETNFRDLRMATLASRDSWPLLTRLAGEGFGGGITYDAVIAETAHEAGAKSLLTLNVRDIERLQPDLDIVEI